MTKNNDTMVTRPALINWGRVEPRKPRAQEAPRGANDAVSAGDHSAASEVDYGYGHYFGEEC